MKNQGFQITLNGNLLCRAGLEAELFVTVCSLTSLKRAIPPSEELSLSIGGLDSVEDHYLNWANKTLQPGVQILIEVVEGDFDAPLKGSRIKAEELVLQEKLQYFHRLKEELKEHLGE
jgi:hypothetical protein